MMSKTWPNAYQPGCCCYCSPRRIGSPNQVAFCSAERRRIFGSERHAQITVFACVFAICVSSLVITNFSGAAPSCHAKAAIMPKVHFCCITTTRKADAEAAPSQSWECNNKDGGALRCYRHQKHQLVNISYRMHYSSIFTIKKISLLNFAGPLLDLYSYIFTIIIQTSNHFSESSMQLFSFLNNPATNPLQEFYQYPQFPRGLHLGLFR